MYPFGRSLLTSSVFQGQLDDTLVVERGRSVKGVKERHGSVFGSHGESYRYRSTSSRNCQLFCKRKIVTVQIWEMLKSP